MTGNPDEEAGEFEFEIREVRGEFGAVEVAHLRRDELGRPEDEGPAGAARLRGKVLIGPAKKPSPGFAMTLGASEASAWSRSSSPASSARCR